MWIEKSANKVEKEREHKKYYGTSHVYIDMYCIVFVSHMRYEVKKVEM